MANKFMMLPLVMVPVGLIGAVSFPTSAVAQSALQRCVRELVEVGVDPNLAAQQCTQGGGVGITRQDECVERAQFNTYQGQPRVREDGRTEYVYPHLQINNGQCWTDSRNFFNPSTVCWSDQLRFRKMSEADAMQQCGIQKPAMTGMGGVQPPPFGGNPNMGTFNGGGFGGSFGGGGSPQAIAQCMDSMLYRTEVQKPFPGWICVPNDVNCKTVRVRTEISEIAAAQACQNAR